MLRARQLREIVTSLGPAYIKLGQALSIRPDILSPAAMNELQKLCDKVGVALTSSVLYRHAPPLPTLDTLGPKLTHRFQSD